MRVLRQPAIELSGEQAMLLTKTVAAFRDSRAELIPSAGFGFGHHELLGSHSGDMMRGHQDIKEEGDV